MSEALPSAARILLSLSIMLFSGFLVTRLTKLLKLPNVSGFILAGVLIGPSALGLISADLVADMGFVSDVALSFIAFGVGKYFKKETLRAAGGATVLITIAESLVAGALVDQGPLGHPVFQTIADLHRPCDLGQTRHECVVDTLLN